MSKLYKNPFAIAGGVLVYVSATAVAYLTFYEPKNGENVVEVLTNEERRSVFNSNANKYDKGEECFSSCKFCKTRWN